MSYAIACINFDPILMWLQFVSNGYAKNNAPYLGTPPRPLHLFHDFSLYFTNRDPNGEPPLRPDHPLNETVAKRVNGHTDGGRIYRIGKFFFPHGSTNFRECPNCGKQSVWLGHNWEYLSQTLFPPPPFETSLFEAKAMSREEETAHKAQHPDAVQCLFCGHMTHANDAPMIMQTSYKGGHASFLEEIQRDLKVCLSGTRHVVLLGYQLPPDDLVWRTVFLANRKPGKMCCSVVVGYRGGEYTGGPKWLDGIELKNYVNVVKEKEAKEKLADFGIPAIESALAIFGDDYVRAYTSGIPQVWMDGDSANKEKILDLLYPKKIGNHEIFPDGIAAYRKNRLNK
jgi:hypothetical protein